MDSNYGVFFFNIPSHFPFLCICFTHPQILPSLIVLPATSAYLICFIFTGSDLFYIILNFITSEVFPCSFYIICLFAIYAYGSASTLVMVMSTANHISQS